MGFPRGEVGDLTSEAEDGNVFGDDQGRYFVGAVRFLAGGGPGAEGGGGEAAGAAWATQPGSAIFHPPVIAPRMAVLAATSVTQTRENKNRR